MKQRKFDPIFIPEPYKFLSTNEHMIIVENCQNGTILKQQRDNVKHLPGTVSNKINNENNHINDKYRYCHCNCDCEDFARQISNKYNDCSSPFSFQDRGGVVYPNGKSQVVHDIEQIVSLLEYLHIRDDNAPIQ